MCERVCQEERVGVHMCEVERDNVSVRVSESMWLCGCVYRRERT